MVFYYGVVLRRLCLLRLRILRSLLNAFPVTVLDLASC